MAESTSNTDSQVQVIVISSEDESVQFTPTKRRASSDHSSDESEDESGVTKGTSCKKRIRFEALSNSDSDNTEDCSEDPVLQHYGGDTELPVYSTTPFGYNAKKLAKCLLTPNHDKVCHVQPLGVTRSASFVVDIDDVEFPDLKADDLGVWKTNGTKKTHFRVLPSGRIWITSSKGTASKSSPYVLTRRYYIHGTYNRFRRIIIDIQDEQGKRHKYAMVQYLLDGPEVEIKIKPHGNSKENKPYFRTAGSTQRRIKAIASSYTPKEAVNILTIQQGGELQAKGASGLPRDRRQIKYARDRQQTKDPNPLYSIMLECKVAQGKSDIFVQDVKAAHQPACVLSTEWQLDDMVRFLTKNHHFGVLTVDTTYNLGEFYVTPIVYPHLMLEDINTRKPPLVLGPILVHQSVDFSAFNYFASTLIGCRRGLQHLMACGTDGDKALVEALTHNFPYAIQLRCFIHFRRNLEEKLKEFGIPSAVADEFIADVFGKRIANTFQEGLVDSTSVDEVEERLHQLKSVWDARESSYSPSSGPRFHDYFCRYHADVVKYHMRKDLRESAGLGSPPARFTTNSSESINTAIKRHVNSKESDWPMFNEKMKQLVQFQDEEIIRALSGRGQYRLRPEYSHFAVPTQQWMRMRPDQRQLIVDDFKKAKLPQQTTTQSGIGMCLTPVATEIGECSAVNQSIVEGSSTPDKGKSNSLHISAQDSGITMIPLVTLEGIWTKTNNLLSTENSVTPAPGDNKRARMVLSYSKVSPHLVQGLSDGQYLCDSNCPQWMSSQICSHVLAAAHDNGELASFLSWYTQCAENPNISTLALSGLSRGRGRKGGQPKRQRIQKRMVPPPDNYSFRPGIVQFAGPGGASEGVSSSVFPTGPPPLISVTSIQPASPIPQLAVVNPFFVKPLAGTIRICQGCRGSLRLADGKVPPPPMDMVIARIEQRSFRDSVGTLRTPSRPSAAHYHLLIACVRAVDPAFIGSSLVILNDVAEQLSSIHYQYLRAQFGL